MRTQRFIIPGRLPGYNELHKANWQWSRRIKQDGMNAVIAAARFDRIRPVESYPVVVRIACYEPNARRDVDNVKSGASKVIMDALQRMGVLANDNRQAVADVEYSKVEVDRDRPRVEVEIAEGVNES